MLLHLHFARAKRVLRLWDAGEFKEEEHPRGKGGSGKGGQFVKKGEEGGGGAAPAAGKAASGGYAVSSKIASLLKSMGYAKQKGKPVFTGPGGKEIEFLPPSPGKSISFHWKSAGPGWKTEKSGTGLPAMQALLGSKTEPGEPSVTVHQPGQAPQQVHPAPKTPEVPPVYQKSLFGLGFATGVPSLDPGSMLFKGPENVAVKVAAPPASGGNATWTVYKNGKPTASGEGNAALIEHLDPTLTKPETAKPEPPEVPPVYKETLPVYGYEHIVTNKETGHQVYGGPKGSILVKPAPAGAAIGNANAQWEFEPTGQKGAIHGAGLANLQNAIEKAAAQAKAAAGSATLPTGAEKILPHKGETTGGGVIYSDDPEAATEELAIDPGGEWTIWQKGQGIVAEGEGQESLNEAFEQLHPRGPGGKFAAKNDTVEEFTAGSKLPPELNGVAFTKFTPPKDWSTVAGQKPDLVEPDMVVPPGKHVSAGLLIQEPDGRVWLVKPSGGFGGYDYTFPKGSQDPGQSLQVTAIREVFEESGLHGEITGFAGDYEGNTSVTRFYLAKRIGGQPTDFEKESSAVTLVPPEHLHQFLNVQRDKDIATNHFIESPAKKGVSAIKDPIEFSELTQTGKQKGSNPGGTFEDKAGQKYYVKFQKSEDHVKNEQLAAALFRAAGGSTLDYHPVASADGKPRSATRLENLAADNVAQLTAAQRTQAQGDFALHAWLANWDAAGTGGDNIGVVAGQAAPIPLDFGGALFYRAQGEPKGTAFGEDATEWSSLRDPGKNPDAAKLYGGMTKKQLQDSAQRLAAVTNGDILNLVEKFGPGGAGTKADLAARLVKRRDSVLKQAGVAATPAAAKPALAKPAAPPGAKDPAKRTSSEAHTLRKQIAGWNPSNKPHSAISNYKGNGYKPINNKMRFSKLRADDMGMPAQNIRAMTEWLDKGSAKEDLVLFRGILKDYADKLHTFAAPGEILTDDGFMSMATYKPFSDSWHHGTGLTFTVRVPKGAKIGTVKQAHEEDPEFEVLAQGNSKLRVISWDPTHSPYGHYEVELVGPEED